MFSFQITSVGTFSAFSFVFFMTAKALKPSGSQPGGPELQGVLRLTYTGPKIK